MSNTVCYDVCSLLLRPQTRAVSLWSQVVSTTNSKTQQLRVLNGTRITQLGNFSPQHFLDCFCACMHVNLMEFFFSLWQSTSYRWGDLGRVPVESDRNCCRLGANGWDEGNILVATKKKDLCHVLPTSFVFWQLLKAWIPLQPGPDSIGIIAVSHNCSGVAARACGLVSLEPTKVCFFVHSSSSHSFMFPFSRHALID